MQWSDIQFSPTERTLRQFAGIFVAVFGVLTAVELLLRDRPTLGMAYGAVAIVVGGLGVVRPSAVRPLFVGWSIVAFPIGWVVSTAILALLFYGLFTPIGLVFRLSGRDLLALRRRSTVTYWMPKPHAQNVKEYFRQS